MSSGLDKPRRTIVFFCNEFDCDEVRTFHGVDYDDHARLWADLKHEGWWAYPGPNATENNKDWRHKCSQCNEYHQEDKQMGLPL